MKRAVILAILAISFLSAWPIISPAHDLWISQQGLRNSAGEWCCGAGDCFVIAPIDVHMSNAGYLLYGKETVPFQEAQPSPDGAFWRCRRPDGTRRCFFAPPPGS